MAKFVKCPNCKEAIAVNYNAELLHCEKCGKTYKNPFFGKEPQANQPVVESKEQPATTSPTPAQAPAQPVAYQPVAQAPASVTNSNHSEFQA